MSRVQLDPKTVDFLGRLCKKAKLKEAFDEERQRKDLLIKQMSEELEPLKPSLRKAMDFSVKQGGQKIKAMDKRGQMKQIETEEAMDTSGLSEKDNTAVYQAMEKLENIKKRMKEAQTAVLDADGNPVLGKDGKPKMKPLFEGWGEDEETGQLKSNDLGLEFYEPLVREGLMPENLVPRPFSGTQQLLDETMKVYEEGVKEDLKAVHDKVDANAYHKQKGGTMDSILARASEAADWYKEYLSTPLAVGKVVTSSGSALSSDLTAVTQGFDLLEKAGVLADIINPIQEGVTAFKQHLTVAAETVSDHLAAALQTAGNHIHEGLGTEISKEVHSASTSLINKLVSAGNKQPLTADQFNEHVQATGNSIKNTFAKHNMGDIGDKLSQAYVVTHEKNLPNIDPSTLNDPLASKQSINDYIVKSGKSLELFVSSMLTIITPVLSSRSSDKAVEKQDKLLAELQQQAKIETVDPEQAARIENAAGVLVTALADSLAKVIGKIDGDTGQIIAGAYRTATKGALVAAYLTQVPPQADKAVNQLAEGFVEALKTCDPNPKVPVFKKLGQTIADTFRGLANPGQLAEQIKANELKNVFPPLHQAGENALAKALGVSLPGGDGTDETSPDAENAKAAKALFKQDGIKAAMQRKIEEKELTEAEEHLEESRRENDDYQRKLVQVDDMGERMAEERSIIRLLQDLQKKRLILSVVMAVTQGGASAVAAFFGPLAAASLGIKFIFQVGEAADRLQWYVTWRQQHAAAVSASSPLYAAMQNFEKNQSEQLLHHTLQATFLFIQIAGNLTATAGGIATCGIAHVVGHAVQATGAAMQNIETLCQQQFDKAEMESAWRLTLKARDNPDNRKLGLTAQNQNPTLAKYAIAWASVKHHDPLAQKAMAACGLNALTLSHKESNVHTVRNYLQTFFQEDRVVVSNKALNTANIDKAETLTVDWQPPSLELSIKSWVIVKKRGETKARPALAAQGTPGIDSLLKKIAVHEQKLQAIKKPAKPEPEFVEAYLKDVSALINELKEYTPRPARDLRREHLEMKEVIKQFVKMAEEREADLMMVSAELQGVVLPEEDTAKTTSN